MAVAFSETQADGSVTGIDADFCRAVAAAVLGDAGAVNVTVTVERLPTPPEELPEETGPEEHPGTDERPGLESEAEEAEPAPPTPSDADSSSPSPQ